MVRNHMFKLTRNSICGNVVIDETGFLVGSGKNRTVTAQRRFGELRECVAGMSLMKGHSAVNAVYPNALARFRCHVASVCYGFNR